MKIASRRLGLRAPLLWLVLPFMAGLAAGRAWGDPPPAASLALALPAALVAAAAVNRARRLWAVALAAAMAAAGSASQVLHRHPLPERAGLPPREARLGLRLDRVAPPKAGRAAASGIATIVRTDAHLRDLAGQRIYFSLAARPTDPPLAPSAVISAVGLLAPVADRAPSGTFAGSLADQGLNFSLTRGRVLRRDRPANAYRRFCECLGMRMNALLGTGLARHPPAVSVYRAMMLGRKGDLAPAQREQFLRSGTMHLFAINGLHIGIVAGAAHAMLALGRCPRPAASLAVLGILWLDVDTTGDSPSAVRAFLMIAAFELAAALRRPIHPLAALAVSALAVLVADPLDFFGASFQMSYGVVSGIVALGLPLAERLQERFPAHPRRPEQDRSGRQRLRAWLQHHLLGAAGVSLAAALVGAVAGIQFFGLVAPAGLAANLAVAPLAGLAIVAGFSSLVVGLAGAAGAARFCNGAAGVLIGAIAAITRVVSRAPGASFPAHFRADWIGPAALAALIAACLAGFAAGWRREAGGFWPPLAVVAMTLLFGVEYRP